MALLISTSMIPRTYRRTSRAAPWTCGMQRSEYASWHPGIVVAVRFRESRSRPAGTRARRTGDLSQRVASPGGSPAGRAPVYRAVLRGHRARNLCGLEQLSPPSRASRVNPVVPCVPLMQREAFLLDQSQWLEARLRQGLGWLER